MTTIESYRKILLSSVAVVSFTIASPLAAEAAPASVEQIQREMVQLQTELTELKAQEQQQKEISAQEEQTRLQQIELKKQQDKISVQLNTISKKDTWYMTGHGMHPVFASKDGKSKFQIHGNVQLDSGLGSVPGQRGTSGGTEFRRVELDIDGVYAKHIVYKVEEDFSKTSSPLGGVTDLFVGYKNKMYGFNNIVLIGNQHTPFIVYPGSSNYTFIEIGLPGDAFGPPRQIGITDQAYTKNWNFWFGAMGQTPTKSSSSLVYQGNSANTLSATLNLEFINHPGHLLSWQNTLAYNNFKSNKPTMAPSPDTSVYGTSFVSTGAMNIQSDLIYGTAADFKDNRLAVRGEFYYVKTQNSDNHTVSAENPIKVTPSFTGWLASASYFLTDDHTEYSTPCGCYGGVDPKHPITQGGVGAFQLLGQIDEVNLNDTKYNIHGGNETNLTAGLNWYPTANQRVMLNYIKVLPVTGGGPLEGHSASIVALRLQSKF